MPKFLRVFVVGLSLMACSTQEKLHKNYKKLKERPPSSATTILFLIDGFSTEALNHQLDKNQIENLRLFFFEKSKSYFLARTTFPSQTFASIGALITEKPVNSSGITGNIVVKEREHYVFESPVYKSRLKEILKDKTIFSRLQKKGVTTASFDYGFGAQATVHVDPTDLELGFELLEKEYHHLDEKIILSLKELLKEVPVSHWPEFIFVHLVGVDLTSHETGHMSKKALNYIHTLDKELGEVLSILKRAETVKPITTIVTSDHGYDKKVDSYFDIERTVDLLDHDVQVIRDGRIGLLYFPKNFSRKRNLNVISHLTKVPEIELLAFREGQHVVIQAGDRRTVFSYNTNISCKDSTGISVNGSSPDCPENLRPQVDNLYYPYFISNLAYYFQASNHPSVIVIPKSGVSFSPIYKGQHGGPTPNELLVPLLIRNGGIKTQTPPPLWQLLDFI